MICRACKKDDGEVVTCGGVIVPPAKYPLPWLCDACAEADDPYLIPGYDDSDLGECGYEWSQS